MTPNELADRLSRHIRFHSALSEVPIKVDDVTATVLTSGAVTAKALPTGVTMPACADGNTSNYINGTTEEVEIWAWNANMGLLYGAGGGQTTKGSLAAEHNVSISIKRQDDTNQMEADLLDTAQKLQSDPNATGTKFITIMGDGGAQFFAAMQPKMLKICPDCGLKVVGVLGYSRGEDGFWGPADWKLHPESAKGKYSIGVLRDGDWNIAEKWAGQNSIPNNPDDTVYDPNALNWINADDYVKAANSFATGTACVDVPTKGKLTGSKSHHCADSVVTWTPGDVTVAKKLGGVVPIMTTQQSVFQMPCILVGIDHWMKGHRKDVDAILAASLEGADQIRSNPAALQKAGEISAKVYNEESAGYWVKYFKGVIEPDAQGVRVHLGGSAVSNLADNLQAFGLNGGPSLFAATYTTFGKIVVQQYPKLVPDFPSVASITDTSYLNDIRGSLPEAPAEDIIKASTAPMKSIEGRRNYAIQFSSGSDKVLASSYGDLDQLSADISLTNYIVALHGYTDASGTPEGNMDLSQRRADAVKSWLVQKGVRNTLRVYGHGQDEPIAPNTTAAGMAKNRRVQVVLGE